MSLLTEEQIEQLVKIASVTSTVKSYHDKFCEWNDKQPSPIEPNWKSLPSKVKYCHLRQYRLDADGNEIDWQFIISHARPVAAHPHAEVMAKYAEVAARRVDPWVEFEYKSVSGGIWEELTSNPSWHTIREYRYIGDYK